MVNSQKAPRSSVLNGSLLGFALVLLLSLPVQAQAPRPDRAVALEQQGNLVGAEREWRLWVQEHPKDANALASLGLVFSKEEKYKEAVDAYRKAIAINPKLHGIQLNLGLAEFKGGNFQAAIAPFRTVLAAAPENFQARTLLGMSYYGAGKFEEASKHLELALKVDPANAELHNVLAQACLSAKKYT